MTQTQENLTTMFETTLMFLSSNGREGLWNNTPAFAQAVDDASDGVAAIRAAAASQETPTGGITDQKAAARDALEEKTLEIADQLAALAATTGNSDLAAQVQMTRSSLDQAQDDDLAQTAERVADLATANIAALADYNVAAADVTALENAATAFSALKTAPRTAAVEKKSATANLAELLASARSIFRNRLDKMITKFRKTNPEFYGGYFAARVIVDRAATHASPQPPPATPPAPNP